MKATVYRYIKIKLTQKKYITKTSQMKTKPENIKIVFKF